MKLKTLTINVLGTMLIGGAAGRPGRAETVDKPCDRACLNAMIENGMVTANNPDGNPMQKMTASEQFETGFSVFITEIRERRYPVVDQERGLVFGFFMFNHPGTVKWVDVPGHGRWEMSANALFPSSMDIAELFKIVNGKITKIEAVMTMQPCGTRDPFLES